MLPIRESSRTNRKRIQDQCFMKHQSSTVTCSSLSPDIFVSLLLPSCLHKSCCRPHRRFSALRSTMDDSCAVCADSLEWVAYGSCGHREVCSTCVVRLRVVLEDRRCCICKTESPTVFVTKALGDYTRVITDFTQFTASAHEGRVGSYWYHEGSQAYFDDVDHYRMIKAMCRLSCSICDNNTEEQGGESTKRRSKFRHIDQLKGHLYHHHRMVMCSLCLEGRKVFICEQNLYTQSQLRQHIHTGDSEVDGSESERGGFTGHPMCEFCRDPFYGDNELYMHMSTEHYTCHICQRQHPGQYDYFRSYDDLEIHFRQEHYLCEDESCLAKKFVVFQTESEMKRHNTIEHGGQMSRSKRNAALQIPTSFRYGRSHDQDQRRGRRRGIGPDPSNDQYAMAIQASLEMAAADGRFRESSSGSDLGETNQAMRASGLSEIFNFNSHADAPPSSSAASTQSSRNAIILEESSFPPLADRELPEPSARYAHALNHGGAAKLAEELFPPLPGAKESSKPTPGADKLKKSTLASRLNRKKGTVKVLNPPRPGLADGCALSQTKSVNFPQLMPIQKPIQNQGPMASTCSNSKPQAAISQVARASTSARANGFVAPASDNSAWCSASGNKMRHSSSAPNLVHTASSSAPAGKQILPAGEQSLSSMDDVQAANKELIERVRIGLGNDEERYAAFKSITAEYRQGVINSWEYISYVEQFGLKHLMLEIAWLCPDRQKQQELIDAYNDNFGSQGLEGNGETDSGASNRSKHGKKQVKGKTVDQSDGSNRKAILQDPFLDQVRKLQLNQKSQEEKQGDVLSKDGYRGAKSLTTLTNLSYARGNPSSSSSGSGGPPINGASSIQNSEGGDQDGENSKQRKKKTSKFNRTRLGEDSPAAQLAVGRSDAIPDRTIGEPGTRPSAALPVRGVWKNNSGQKLFQK